MFLPRFDRFVGIRCPIGETLSFTTAVIQTLGKSSHCLFRILRVRSPFLQYFVRHTVGSFAKILFLPRPAHAQRCNHSALPVPPHDKAYSFAHGGFLLNAAVGCIDRPIDPTRTSARTSEAVCEGLQALRLINGTPTSEARRQNDAHVGHIIYRYII